MFIGKKIQIKCDNFYSYVIIIKCYLCFKINVLRVCWMCDEDVELKREGKLFNFCILVGF